MPTFENVEVIGPGARREEGRAPTQPETPSAARPSGTEEANTGRTAWLKTNRRLAIFGAFAVGVFLGSLARS